jgi:hypothetical protein
MLSDEDVEAVARVVVARATQRQDRLDPADVARAYHYLQAVREAECNPDLDRALDEIDPGQAVECAVRRLMVNGAAAAWPLLKRIVELCPRDRDVLGSIGAGMFEDWVTEDGVASVESELRLLLRSDAKWRVVAEASWDEPPSLARLLADPSNLPSDPL